MGLIADYRTSLENPSTPLSYPAEWLLDIFNGGRTDSGIRVSEMTALQTTTVFACVEIKAGALGFLDLQVKERTVADGRVSHVIAYDHVLYDLLEHDPNPEMTSFTLRKTVQAHRMLWGNGYIELQRDGGNQIIALWPRNPARIRPHRTMKNIEVNGELVKAGEMVYLTTEGMETESLNPESPTPDPVGAAGDRIILPADLLHIPGLALDGRIGQSVIQLARNAVGLALATEKFGGKFFGNGAVGFGAFEYPQVMNPEDREVFRRSVQEAWGGENQLRPLLLEAGVKYTPTSTKPNEAQFLETRKFQIEELCRLFGVPPHMVGVSEKTNRANTEQIGIEFITFHLNPDLRSWQQEMKRKLFPAPAVGRSARRNFSAVFDTRALIMPDAASRLAYNNAAKQWGWGSTNDIHQWEGLNPVDDPSADAYWMPINMQDMAKAFEEPAQGPGPADGSEGAGDEGTQGDGKKDKSKSGKGGKRALLMKRLVRAYSRLFRDAFGRVCARRDADYNVFRQAFQPVLVSLGEELEQLAAAEFNAEPDPEEFERSKFLADYIEGMRTRLTEWKLANGNSDQVAFNELVRAARAISIEIYRSIGTRVAKQQNKILTETIEEISA